MTLLVISFIAGLLTVLAPCVLPLLPVIIGGSLSGQVNKWKPYIITGSLALSIVFFTLILKASTAFINVPPSFWTNVSGIILIVFSVTMIFPGVWEKLALKFKFSHAGNRWLAQGSKKGGVMGDVIMGLALGPVFSSCSPTYFVILATVLPASFLLGTVYLLAYALGLSIILLAIALLGQKFSQKLGVLSDPYGKFKKIIGILFLLVGLAIITGVDKKIEAGLVNLGIDFTGIEHKLLEKTEDKDASVDKDQFPDYVEISNPSGFVNTDPITIEQYVGDKVILIDFMTYSCINCQRTFPYLVSWYEKYQDDGLIIIGIHTPEFAFEQNIENVKTAMKKFAVEYPVVLDNNYETWRAYQNKYWPRKYLIDIDGKIVYDHIGEGDYEETEKAIQDALKERASRMGTNISKKEIEKDSVKKTKVGSPETYFGSARNEYLANGVVGKSGTQNFSIVGDTKLNGLYLEGKWDISSEYAKNFGPAKISFKYFAKDVHLVLDSQKPIEISIYQDGVFVKNIKVDGAGLYTLLSDSDAGQHLLEIEIKEEGLESFAFTFG